MLLYKILLITQYVLALVTFFSLFKITAGYGRHLHVLPKKKQVFLSYRTGWLIMEIPALLTIFIMYIFSPYLRQGEVIKNIFSIPTFFLLLWEIHYVYRTLIFPFLQANKKNKFTLSIAIGGAFFNICNGFINGWFLFYMGYSFAQITHNAFFWIGIILFFTGYIIHILSDKALRDIKKKNQGEYAVPHAFLHKYVTSPNYFGEIIQWFGFFLITQSPAALAFAVFTVANLAPRAYAHRKWYVAKFSEYPKNRKVIIPFLL